MKTKLEQQITALSAKEGRQTSPVFQEVGELVYFAYADLSTENTDEDNSFYQYTGDIFYKQFSAKYDDEDSAYTGDAENERYKAATGVRILSKTKLVGVGHVSVPCVSRNDWYEVIGVSESQYTDTEVTLGQLLKPVHIMQPPPLISSKWFVFGKHESGIGLMTKLYKIPIGQLILPTDTEVSALRYVLSKGPIYGRSVSYHSVVDPHSDPYIPEGANYYTALQLYGFAGGGNVTENTLAELLASGAAKKSKCTVLVRYLKEDVEDGKEVPELAYVPVGTISGGGDPPEIPEPDSVKGGVLNGESIGFTGNGAYEIFEFATGAADEHTLSELVGPETLPAVKSKYKLLARKDEITGPKVAYIEVEDLTGGLPAGAHDGDLLQWDASEEVWKAVKPTTLTVLTKWRLDKGGHKFQVKTTSITVVTAAPESGWTNISDSDGGTLEPGVEAEET